MMDGDATDATELSRAGASCVCLWFACLLLDRSPLLCLRLRAVSCTLMRLARLFTLRAGLEELWPLLFVQVLVPSCDVCSCLLATSPFHFWTGPERQRWGCY